MFNRSWYKNTWLGKKLGFKIDWETENLVREYDNKTEVLFVIEGKVYIGCTKKLGMIDGKVGIYEDFVDLSMYKIVYDPTKKDAIEQIKELQNRTLTEEVFVTITLGRGDKYKDYKMCDEFYTKAGMCIIDEYPVWQDKWGYYHIRFKCKECYANGVKQFAKIYLK